MFGPIFIHQQKTFATYNFFFSQLVGLKPKLQDIQRFEQQSNLQSKNSCST